MYCIHRGSVDRHHLNHVHLTGSFGYCPTRGSKHSSGAFGWFGGHRATKPGYHCDLQISDMWYGYIASIRSVWCYLRLVVLGVLPLLNMYIDVGFVSKKVGTAERFIFYQSFVEFCSEPMDFAVPHWDRPIKSHIDKIAIRKGTRKRVVVGKESFWVPQPMYRQPVDGVIQCFVSLLCVCQGHGSKVYQMSWNDYNETKHG